MCTARGLCACASHEHVLTLTHKIFPYQKVPDAAKKIFTYIYIYIKKKESKLNLWMAVIVDEYLQRLFVSKSVKNKISDFWKSITTMSSTIKDFRMFCREQNFVQLKKCRYILLITCPSFHHVAWNSILILLLLSKSEIFVIANTYWNKLDRVVSSYNKCIGDFIECLTEYLKMQCFSV